MQAGEGRTGGSIVGRERELELLDAFLASAATNGGALLLTGEPGVGKTGLLDITADVAAAAGSRVLRAAGIEFEAGMSYAGLNQVLLPLLEGLSDLPPLQRDALNVALGFGESGAPTPLVVSNAALALLRSAGDARPVLVIIDDLPWLDRSSASALGFVARRLEGSRVGLIGASRTGVGDFFDRAGLPELVVEPLDEAASQQLLDERFPDLARAARERILQEAQGNPLALLELPAALGSRMRASVEPLPPTLPLGRRLEAVFRSRIQDLPSRTRQLLLRMALDGTGDVRVLDPDGGAASGFAVLVAAEHAGLASFDSATHRLAFRHPLVRSTVVELSNAEERRAAHRGLAEAWVDQPDRRAWHLAEATIGPDEAVASQLEAAASRILARGDSVGSVQALTRAAELSPGTAERRRRLAAAAYIGADVTGNLSNAAQVLADLRRGHTEVEGSLPAAVAAALFLLQGDGDVPTAHRVLVGALDGREGRLDAHDPVVAEALHALLLVCSYGGTESLWHAFEAALDRSDRVPPVLALSRRTHADPARSAAVLGALDDALATMGEEADPTQIIRMGIAASYVDRLEACRPALSRLVTDARQGGAIASGLQAMLVLSFEEFEAGSWDTADALVREAVDICEPLGYRNATWPGRYVQALVAAARGDQARTRELTDGLVGWGQPRGVRVNEVWAWQARGLAALARGDVEDAYQQASRISPPGRLAPYVPFALYVMLDLVESAIRTGRTAEAAAHVAAMQDGSIAELSPRTALVVHGCAAMVAPDDVAFALFDEALRLPEVERWPFDHARIQLAYGERLRRARAMTESRVQLGAALATFERLAAYPWVDRANAELRATGLTKPKGGESTLDRLTPQEFEIASLAASGLTNKQIGERLFLSHRTVGGHLHRAFPKLGVSTRAALRDAIAALPPAQRPRT
jgi:DNA-binding CsgD family transcriptional regulator